MNRPGTGKLAAMGAAGVLALAGITGGVSHVAHASSATHAVVTHASGAQPSTSGDADNVQQQDGAGSQADTAAPESASPEASAEASGPDNDATAPCAGTGDTQTGNCDTQSGDLSQSGN